MRLISAALAVALTPVFVALPTVSFASADPARPVPPKVTTTAITGVDATALADAAAPAPSPGADTRPEGLTAQRRTARFTVAGVSWKPTAGLSTKDVLVQVRVKEDRGWTGWQRLGTPDEAPDATTPEAARARLGTEPLMTPGATAIQVRVDTPNGVRPTDLQVTTIDPGTSPADDDLSRAQPAASASAAAVQPTIITRAQWGADESLRSGTSTGTTVKAIVIHHTAGTNTYEQADAAGIVRGIYAYHTKTLGWSDVGYNFLVDKWGRIYEGRAGSITAPVIGAHSLGFNTDTMGVSALGNYETVAAPAAMVDGMARVSGWKLSQYAVSPTGTARLTSAGGTNVKYAKGTLATLPAIHGHRDTYATACPGRNLYSQFAALRTAAGAYAQVEETPTEPPPTEPPPVDPEPVPTAGLFAAYGDQVLAVGSQGDAVRDLQLELNRRGFSVGTADGDFGPMTASGVTAFQKSARLYATSQVATNDWKALSGLAYVQTAVPGAGWDGDGRGDVLGRIGTGDLYFYPTAIGSIGTPVRIGTGWNIFDIVLSPGDWTGDGRADVLARKPNGDLFLYRGNGTGGWASAGVQIGRGWNMFVDIHAPGDWNGDKKPDLLGRRSNGDLYLYAGNGSGSFAAAGKRIGTGWQIFADLVTPGDWSGDGRPDLLARKPNGDFLLYRGNGLGGWASAGVKIGGGWHIFNTVLSTGDLNGDGASDLIARTPSGVNYLYAGNGKGGFAGRVLLKAPWGDTTRIFGVR